VYVFKLIVITQGTTDKIPQSQTRNPQQHYELLLFLSDIY